jgi:glycosyltransferase involved in cell wall biosynthesis
MKICICTHNFPLRPDYTVDAGCFVLDFAHELVKLREEILVYTPDMDGIKADYPKLRVRWFDWFGGDKKLGHLSLLNPLDYIKLLSLLRNGCKGLLNFAQQNNFDISLAMWAFPSGFFAYQVKRTLGIPYSVWVLGRDIWIYAKYPILKNLIKAVLRNADFLFADGLRLSDEVEALSGRKCRFLPTARILPAGGELEADIDKRKINFLFIGRYEKAKGVDILIEAMNLLVTEGLEANLYMFGVGSLEKYLRKRTKELKIEKEVFLKGYASPNTVVSYMKKCDCLVIPSRIESIPVIFSDALQMEIPVIVTDVGDMGQIARKWKVGQVIPSTDVEELRKAMRDFMKEGNSGWAEGRKKLASEFDLSMIARKYLKCIEG